MFLMLFYVFANCSAQEELKKFCSFNLRGEIYSEDTSECSVHLTFKRNEDIPTKTALVQSIQSDNDERPNPCHCPHKSEAEKKNVVPSEERKEDVATEYKTKEVESETVNVVGTPQPEHVNEAESIRSTEGEELRKEEIGSKVEPKEDKKSEIVHIVGERVQSLSENKLISDEGVREKHNGIFEENIAHTTATENKNNSIQTPSDEDKDGSSEETLSPQHVPTKRDITEFATDDDSGETQKRLPFDIEIKTETHSM